VTEWGRQRTIKTASSGKRAAQLRGRLRSESQLRPCPDWLGTCASPDRGRGEPLGFPHGCWDPRDVSCSVPLLSETSSAPDTTAVQRFGRRIRWSAGCLQPSAVDRWRRANRQEAVIAPNLPAERLSPHACWAPHSSRNPREPGGLVGLIATTLQLRYWEAEYISVFYAAEP